MVVTKENLSYYAWTNIEFIPGEVKAVMLDFQGLGFKDMKTIPGTTDLELASKGILTVVPYYAPWSWMNREAVRLVDEIVEVIYETWKLSSDVPLISTGGSMGGLCALIYCVYGKKTPSACYANCPVCDLPYHATERPDLPRTMYAAFSHYECGIDEALRLTSPVHQVQKLPFIPYLIIHADKDPAVNNDRHSRVLVEKMKELGHRVEYIVTRSDWHCAYNDYKDYKRMLDFITSNSMDV